MAQVSFPPLGSAEEIIAMWRLMMVRGRCLWYNDGGGEGKDVDSEVDECGGNADGDECVGVGGEREDSDSEVKSCDSDEPSNEFTVDVHNNEDKDEDSEDHWRGW